MRNLFLYVPLCVVLAGCGETRLRKTLPPDVRVDTFNQLSASKVDVLWVVDNSGSMAARQENLAKNFQSFISVFSRGSIDFRIAVTTTDIFKDQGQFRGNPKVLSPSTPNLASAFAANIRVGSNGSPYEAGMQAAQLALDRQSATNVPRFNALDTCVSTCALNTLCKTNCETKNPIDFLRRDAYLYLIFVTDEEDESGQDLRYYWRAFETAKGIGNDGTVTTAAIIGDVPSNGCGATPGARYLGLSQLTGGEVGSICDASFGSTLKKLANNAVGLKRKFVLAKAPNPDTIQVAVRYPCDTADEGLSTCVDLNRDACKDVAPETTGLVCTPPQGGADGWSYEPTSNAVYFSGDSVPGLHAAVDLQYYEEGKGP